MDELRSAPGREVRTAAADGAPTGESPVEVNERGFMRDLSRWTPEAAQYLARHQGLAHESDELTADHLRVIGYVRSYYHRVGRAPSRHDICAELGLTNRQLSQLFPGALKTVLRVSGLSGPTRSANGRTLSDAQQLLTGNWWVRLTG